MRIANAALVHVFITLRNSMLCPKVLFDLKMIQAIVKPATSLARMQVYRLIGSAICSINTWRRKFTLPFWSARLTISFSASLTLVAAGVAAFYDLITKNFHVHSNFSTLGCADIS